MGFSLDISVSAATVFLQGILSFFSPCVLPLLPLYMGYLAGGAAEEGGGSRSLSRRGRTLINTFCFVLGVSFAIFLLGLGFTAAGQFFRSRLVLFSRLGGVLILLLGLYQLGAFGQWMALERERRLPFRMDRAAASPVTALALGFVFSFAWTPCVGPALTSVLLLAASAASRSRGFLLIGVYALGFALPFLAAGLCTDFLLDFVRRHRNAARYTAKAGGAALLLVGVMLLTGCTDGASVQQTEAGQQAGTESAGAGRAGAEQQIELGQTESEQTEGISETEEPSPAAEPPGQPANPAPDFTLPDQNGVLHSLSDYRGKVVFLNFWATWCPPCRSEMPDIQSLDEAYESQGEAAEAAILGVAAPGAGGERDTAGVASFLAENGYSYPVVMDETADLLEAYGISAFPTTFMIDRAGNVFGYVEGSLPRSAMEDIIAQTLERGSR